MLFALYSILYALQPLYFIPGCFPWETAPTDEELTACADGILAGLTDGADYIGERYTILHETMPH